MALRVPRPTGVDPRPACTGLLATPVPRHVARLPVGAVPPVALGPAAHLTTVPPAEHPIGDPLVATALVISKHPQQPRATASPA